MRAFLTSESLPAMGEDSPGRTKKMGSLRRLGSEGNDESRCPGQSDS